MNPYPRVSVIVPLYNKRDYVRQCVESLLAQTLHEIEVIVVDDGSTDGSGAVMDALLPLDTRVRVIRQENVGPSAARNAGLAVARGEFVGFVDADDWVEPNMYAALHQLASELSADCARCGQIRERSSGRALMPHDADTFVTRSSELYHQLFSRVYLPLMSVANGIYRRSILDAKQLRFCENLRNMEDILFNAHFFALDVPVVISHNNYYHYRVAEPSLSDAPFDLLPSIECLAAKIEELEQNAPIAAAYHESFMHYLSVIFLILFSDAGSKRVTATFGGVKQRVEALCAASLFVEMSTDLNRYQAPRLLRTVAVLARLRWFACLAVYARTLAVLRGVRKWMIRR